MDVIEFSAEQSQPIQSLSSVAAGGVAPACGRGESHVDAIDLERSGSIGSHEAGFDPLLLSVRGSGCAGGVEGAEHGLREGPGGFIRTGETYAKASEAGRLAVMVQACVFSAPGITA